jgi:hypothetical protein
MARQKKKLNLKMAKKIAPAKKTKATKPRAPKGIRIIIKIKVKKPITKKRTVTPATPVA